MCGSCHGADGMSETENVPDLAGQPRTFIETHGFTAVRPLTRMVHGRSTAFDDGERTVAVVGPEFG